MEKPGSFADTLSLPQVDLLRDLYKFKIKRINWDLDQILSNTESPVKNEFFIQTGIDYRDRPIDQWLALSNWASSENKMSFEEAKEIEEPIWSSPDVLAKSLPMAQMQTYSELAYDVGIKQTIVTTRKTELRDQTFDWIKSHFSWINSDNIYIRSSNKTNSDQFKGSMVGALNSQIHFEDSTKSAEEVIRLSDASVILFPRNLEKGRFSNTQRVIEFPDMKLWYEMFKLHQ